MMNICKVSPIYCWTRADHLSRHWCMLDILVNLWLSTSSVAQFVAYRDCDVLESCSAICGVLVSAMLWNEEPGTGVPDLNASSAGMNEDFRATALLTK